jgi:uncharacterized protein YndB with AHSA1/START domain
VTLDPRVGGTYRIAMQPPDGELFHLAGNTSRSNHQLAWPTRSSGNRSIPTTAKPWHALHCESETAQKEVELIRGPFATEARRELHEAGWADTLARLASRVAPA